jgi:cytochrome c556
MTLLSRTGTAIVLVSVALVGCASMKAKMNPDEAIAARQDLMKKQGAAMRSIADKMKAGQVQAVADDAKILEDTAKKITPLFPEGSLNANTSRAKPEIWQRWSEFEGHAKKLEEQAKLLADTAKTGNADATGKMVADIGRGTCGGCHTPFRGPEIKK